jgi:HD-GYP domain-containing protein (c-di-GMP phosphodiesterase class II)/PAS domain-containing protein
VKKTESKHKQIEETLQQRDKHYYDLFENVPISIWEKDFSDVKQYLECLRKSGIQNLRTYFNDHPDEITKCAAMTKLVDVNEFALKKFKARSKDEFREGFTKIFGPGFNNGFKEELIAIVEGKVWFECETVGQTLQGDIRYVIKRWFVPAGCEDTFSRVLVSVIDITERKKAAEKLRRVNRTLKTLSATNQLLVRSSEESELLNKTCQILVGTGGYCLAWVGFAEQDPKKTVRPVAQAGYEKKYPEMINITWADTEEGRGPAGTAIRAGKPCICRNIMTDPNYVFLRTEAAEHGYASSIALPLIADGETIGALNVYAAEPDAFTSEEVKMLTELSDDLTYGIMALRMRIKHVHAEENLKQSVAELRRSFEGTIMALESVVEYKDPYTSGHQLRVTQLACAIAKEMCLPNDRINGLYLAGLVHDVGKTAIPAEILSKPGRLTEAEYCVVKTHAQVGYDILKNITFPGPIAQIALQHHERIDGSGYPQGLSDSDILLEAKIIAVADVVEAMSSHRPYRPALGMDAALAEISKKRGVLYAAEVVDACLKVIQEKEFTFD